MDRAGDTMMFLIIEKANNIIPDFSQGNEEVLSPNNLFLLVSYTISIK